MTFSFNFSESTEACGVCLVEKVVDEGELACFKLDFFGLYPACLAAIVEFEFNTKYVLEYDK